jgi:hypothetical protein
MNTLNSFSNRACRTVDYEPFIKSACLGAMNFKDFLVKNLGFHIRYTPESGVNESFIVHCVG